MNQKPTGIVRKVDDLGRIVLPAEMRRVLKIDVQDSVDIQLQEDGILIQKHPTCCALCGATKNLITVKDKYICSDCLKNIKDL
nr:AbrB/MazE/SpoVT family DNA-binding domain-containing protein [uncultured Butyricicoccus sp.]